MSYQELYNIILSLHTFVIRMQGARAPARMLVDMICGINIIFELIVYREITQVRRTVLGI